MTETDTGMSRTDGSEAEKVSSLAISHHIVALSFLIIMWPSLLIGLSYWWCGTAILPSSFLFFLIKTPARLNSNPF